MSTPSHGMTLAYMEDQENPNILHSLVGGRIVWSKDRETKQFVYRLPESETWDWVTTGEGLPESEWPAKW